MLVWTITRIALDGVPVAPIRSVDKSDSQVRWRASRPIPASGGQALTLSLISDDGCHKHPRDGECKNPRNPSVTFEVEARSTATSNSPANYSLTTSLIAEMTRDQPHEFIRTSVAYMRTL
jgi:hypothetical protein